MQSIVIVAFLPQGAADTLRGSEVLDMEVRTAEGKVRGTVEDLVIDLDHGLVRAVVVGEDYRLHPHSVMALSRPSSKASCCSSMRAPSSARWGSNATARRSSATRTGRQSHRRLAWCARPR